jgi:hypothetical protein
MQAKESDTRTDRDPMSTYSDLADGRSAPPTRAVSAAAIAAFWAAWACAYVIATQIR